MNDHKIRKQIAKVLGVFDGHVIPTDFGRGRHGFGVHVWGQFGPMMATIELVARGDGTHILRAAPAGWVVERIKALGFELEPRPKEKLASVERAPAVVGMPGQTAVMRSERQRATAGTAITDPSMRTIGQRIKALREEAKTLALYLQEPDEDIEDEEDEYREADTETAIGLMEALEEVEDPSPAVAALPVEYRTRPDWSPLGQARDIKDELEAINEVFRASGIEDQDFDAWLEEVQGWMCEL